MAELIPYDDRDGVIWIDGAMVPWRDAKLHVLSHALHYGSCVFEGERVYDGRIFKLEEHTQRLFDSAEMLQLSIPYDQQTISDANKAVVAEQNIGDGYVRPVAWRGPEQMGVSAQETKTHVAIAAWPWPAYFGEEARERGIRLATSKWRRPAPDTAPVKAKAAGLYMICTLSKHEAEANGYHDALMLDWRGNVAEATGANIFLVQNGVIHTPDPDCFLDGITRRTVMDLARKRGYEIVERTVTPEDFAKTDEVFLTGTAAEVTPVGEIDGHNYQVGPVTRQMMDDYEAVVRGR
jgi:branched-chain amino acid aminotransferase